MEEHMRQGQKETCLAIVGCICTHQQYGTHLFSVVFFDKKWFGYGSADERGQHHTYTYCVRAPFEVKCSMFMYANGRVRVRVPH